MASRFANLISRSAVPRAGLGNLLINPGARQSKGPGPKVATLNVNWQSPGQPQILDQDIQFFGEDAYLHQVYVMRCVQTIANTIAGLELRAGIDPTQPQNNDPTAPLCQLLGPASPQAPGGPNPNTASRAFWAWSICQYLVYGRFAWECQLENVPGSNIRGKEIVGLWPLVAACVKPIPSQGAGNYFDSFVYTTPMAGDIGMTRDQMIYAWRPSLTDWRVPETVLSAAKFPIYIAKGLDKYMCKLLDNDMVASTLVVTPPFDEPSARRAWQEQFLTTFSGVDNRGKTIFAEAEYDEDDTSGKPLVQVEKIAQTAVEASLLEIAKTAKDEICVALGVPLSLIGNAQERIYANAESEYKNFWTLTVINLITEIQDHINTLLAPRLGQEVGWFDLSRVAALQPPPIFAPPMVGDVINFGVASAEQVANVLGIPAADINLGAEDTETVEIGEESSKVGPSGVSRSSYRTEWTGTRVTKNQLINAARRYDARPLNTFNLKAPFRASEWLEQERIETRTVFRPAPPIEAESTLVALRPALDTSEAKAIITRVSSARSRRAALQLEARTKKTAELVEHTRSISQGARAMALTSRIGINVHRRLADHYPESTLGWVDDAGWRGPEQVPLEAIDMHSRPGGRDPKKVAGIIQGIHAGRAGALAPVVLVKTPGSDKLKIADGYHRTKAHEKMGHESIHAYIGAVDDEEGPWDTEMHDKKLNRAQELVMLHRRWDTSPGANWHNSDGPSPHGTKEQFIHHMIEVHGVTSVDKSMSKEQLDMWHTADHNSHGECGAHDKSITKRAWLPQEALEITRCAYCGQPSTITKQAATGVLPLCNGHASETTAPDQTYVAGDEAGSRDASDVHETEAEFAQITAFAGTDLDQWLLDNEAGLLELAEAESA